MDGLEQLEACRICVTCFPLEDMDFINIFQPNEEFQQELDFIKSEIRQWELKIQPDDGLPQRICANCFAKFCSIETFRNECEAAQKKLIETVLQQTEINEPEIQHLIKNNETPLPLVGNYENGNVSLDSGSNILVSSVDLTQTDVCLNDFPVFDQQFSQYDNPALIDASSTLLDNNFIAPEPTQELGYLPSQNLFTFETAEPPTTGTLPLDETETTSIMNDILVEKNVSEVFIKHDDLDDMLQHSIIPTTAKLTTQTSRLNIDQQEKVTNTDFANIDCNKNHYSSNNHALKFKSEFQNTTVTFLNREDNNSDIECEDTDMNPRLKVFSYACHYCFCPETGPIDHLVFQNEDALSQHFFDVHEPNRPYTCPKCPQSSKTKLLRDNHVKLIHKIIEYQTCNYCQKRLKGSTDVHQYNCQFVGNWKCEQCQEKFPNTPLFRFRLHQRQHDRTKQFKCRLCERSFIRKANLEAHQRMHKAEAQSTFTCDICKSNFSDDYELKRHKYQQHNDEYPLKCKLCKKGFSSHVFLQRHLNQFHSDNANVNNKNIINDPPLATSPSSSSPTENHVCLNCNMEFKSLQKLQQHLQLGRDKSGSCLYASCSKQERRKLQRQGVFPCFHCPRRFHLRSQLDKHLNTHDARLRPYQCEQCVTRCRTSFELKQHVNIAHLNIKAFACDKCGKCFGYKKDLRDHMLFHAEINVRCTETGCAYVCKNEKALNDHIRHKHRLLSCEYCHEQFTRQKLTAHLRKAHRTEIDVELAGESDNFYKSQLLNNNNDITQISFNLLNAQQTDQQLRKTSPQLTPTSISSQILVAAINSVQLQTQTSITSTSSSSTLSSTSTPLLTPSPSTTTIATSSPSLTSCLTNSTTGTSVGSNSASISAHNLIDDVDPHHDQLCAIFANESTNSNATTLALNGLVSNDHDLSLVANDTANMFLVPSTSTATTDNQLDQYFMASLIDTEQEIIVT